MLVAAGLACLAGWAGGTAWAQGDEGLAAPAAAALQAAQQADGPQGAAPRLSLAVLQPLPTAGAGGALDVGVQWRPVQGPYAVDLTAWRRTTPHPDALSLVYQREPVVFGARAEMKIPTSRRGFAAEYRFLGLQLDNGARIGLRRTNGNPTLYYRSQF